MKWVTWEHIGVDRMGSGWLIQRYIDHDAEFLFVPSTQRTLPPDAEPFDILGDKLFHLGSRCTFQTVLDVYHLDDPRLHRLGRIVAEADVVHEVQLEPVAMGLDTICRGIRLISPDDHVALE